MPMEANYGITIDESNLAERVSMALYAYRRQKDRVADILDSTQKIVSGN